MIFCSTACARVTRLAKRAVRRFEPTVSSNSASPPRPVIQMEKGFEWLHAIQDGRTTAMTVVPTYSAFNSAVAFEVSEDRPSVRQDWKEQ